MRRLVLVELDRELARELGVRYQEHPDVTVVQGDVLRTDLSGLVEAPGRLKVLGNIPYHITTPIVFHLLKRPRPAVILIMVQREVAERLLAPPGTAAYGALAVGVRTVASVERVLEAPRGALRPVPGVDSTVVRIRPLDPPPLDEREEARLRTLTRAAFQWRRKQMQKILRDHPDLALSPEALSALQQATGADLTRRPETFSPEDFVRFSRLLPGSG